MRVMVRLGDIELSDESYQESLDLDDANQEADLSVPGKSGYKKQSTHANRHPRQPLTPPENVELGGREVTGQYSTTLPKYHA